MKHIITALNRHMREFRRYAANNQYEQTDSGILFPKAGATLHGTYHLNVNGDDVGDSPNLITTEGLNHLLAVGFNGVAATPTWYLALFHGNYTPVAGLTAANFAASASENTSITEGYSEATRREFNEAAPAAGTVTSAASPATFTFATSSSVTIYGAALLSNSVRGSATGVCMSATRFASPRVFYNTDTFSLGYSVSLTSG